MIDMAKKAREYEQKNFGKGSITKITDYSFTWTIPSKTPNGNPIDIVYYESYYVKLKGE